MESNTTVQDNNPEKRAIIPDIMSQLDYGDNDPNLSSESVMYTPKDERTPSESLKKAKELEKSLPISKKEKAAVDALLDMYVLDETKEKEIAMNIDKKSRKIRKRYTSSPSNLVLKLSIEKDGKYKLKRGGKRRNRKTIPLTQYGGSPQDDFFDAIRKAHNDVYGLCSYTDLVTAFLSRPDINARVQTDSNTSDDNGPFRPRRSEGFTALFYCCLAKRPDLVRLLLQNGAILMGQELLALIMEKSESISNPIEEENTNLEIATMLLDHEHTYDVDNDIYEVYRWNDGLGGVILPGDIIGLRVRNMALPRDSSGARLSYVNSIYSENMSTALHWASHKSQPSVVRLLLERGANIDAVASGNDGVRDISPLKLAKRTLVKAKNMLDELNASDPDWHEFAEIRVSKAKETISILKKHYAKRNAKQHLVDQMGPPNMKDLQTTAELPRGRRVTANTDDYSIQDGDGVIRKKIKSYLGGNRTRNLLKYKIKESVLS